MAELAKALSSVIWEQCVTWEKCVHIPWPFNKDICVSVGACLRLIERDGSIVLQVEAAGQQFEFALMNACYTVFTIGVGHIDLCLAVNGPNSLRLQAKACIGWGPINQCWDIWGTDIHWLTAGEFARLDLSAHGIVAPDTLPGFVAMVDEFQPALPAAPCRCR